MDNFLFYGHSGSGNRGCEAIVKTSINILRNSNINNKIILSTLDEEADKKAGLAPNGYISNRFLRPKSMASCYSFFCAKLLGRTDVAGKIMYKNLLKHLNNNRDYILFFSIGGDNYCYESPAWLYTINEKIDKSDGKRILWGCSMESETINDKMKQDLSKYCLITSRESITYKALLDKRIDNKNCRLKVYPDPAFLLNVDYSKSNEHLADNVVGINLSPLVTRFENQGNIVNKNYYKLINYLLKSTDTNIALIPHVTIKGNSDYDMMLPLYNEFKVTGRIRIIDNTYTASEYKGIISRCRMFIGARTHATIAAYSTCVPTLAVGYSVKARGIARDIFGSEENMVISVQSLKHEDDLVNAFKYIQENEEDIRKHLQEFMPSYIKKAWLAGEEVKKLLEK